jgi:hypothetical protein
VQIDTNQTYNEDALPSLKAKISVFLAPR